VSSIGLVRGGFVAGSGWEHVYHILRKSGHAVTVVQNPTTPLADDVSVTKRALDRDGFLFLDKDTFSAAICR